MKIKGYYFNKEKQLFRSQIKINNDSYHLGYFKTEAEANKAYKIAKRNLIKLKNNIGFQS